MALFRALSTRRGQQRGGGYDRLLDETVASNGATFSDDDHHHYHHHHHQHHHEAVLKRVTSVPASMLFGSSSKKPGYEIGSLGNNKSKQQQVKGKKSSSKISHPIFSLFDGKSWSKKKKITANPDFSRYIEYLKEGGMLNKGTNSPVI